MKRSSSNQKGFAAVEAVLIVVIVVAIAGVGWYVYKSLHSINGTYNSATQTSNSGSPKFSKTTKKATTTTKKSGATTTPASATKYFTITQWGVRAPYLGSDTYTYTISSDNSNVATVVSAQLAAKYSGCSTYGAGQINRYTGSQGSYPDGSGPTVAQAAQQNPGTYVHIGNYYYRFLHDQAGCTSNSTDQNNANDAVQALVAKLQAVPN